MKKRKRTVTLSEPAAKYLAKVPDASAYVNALVDAVQRACIGARKQLARAGWSRAEINLALAAVVKYSQHIPDTVDLLAHAHKIGHITRGTRVTPARWREMIRNCKKDTLLTVCVTVLVAEKFIRASR